MYVARANWSQPEGTDPAPCFRQGDLVRIRWVHMDHSLVVNTLHAGISERLPVAELREELVVLVGTCCDLVLHPNPKRKGVQISPLREVPKNIRSDATLLEALNLDFGRVRRGAKLAPSPRGEHPDTRVHHEFLSTRWPALRLPGNRAPFPPSPPQDWS